MGICFELKPNLKNVINKKEKKTTIGKNEMGESGEKIEVENNEKNAISTTSKEGIGNKEPENELKKSKKDIKINKRPHKNKNVSKGGNKTSEIKPLKEVKYNADKLREKKEISKKQELKKSYSNFDINKDYYLICPDCQTTHEIINFEYDEENNDFIIYYYCQNNEKKNYFINFLSTKKPLNHDENYISKNLAEKMKEIAEEKKDSFKGFKLFLDIFREKFYLNPKWVYQKEFAIDQSAAIPININEKEKYNNIENSCLNNLGKEYINKSTSINIPLNIPNFFQFNNLENKSKIEIIVEKSDNYIEED